MPACPGFGTPMQLPEYYEKVSALVAALKPFSTLRHIALHLNKEGFQTPSGKSWNRQTVANFVRSSGYTNKHKEIAP